MYLPETQALDSWDVMTHPIYTSNGMEIKGYHQIRRTDTHDVLHVSKNTYQPIENNIFLDVVNTLKEDLGCNIEKSGSFKNGRQLFVQFTNDEFIKAVIPGDKHGKVEGYATLANSHDGSLAFRFFTGIIRIWCSNTFQQANNSVKDMILSVKHTRNARDRIEKFTDSILTISKIQKDIVTVMEQMAEQRTFSSAHDFAVDLYGMEYKPRPIKKKVNGKMETISWTPPMLSSRGKNIVNTYDEIYNNYGSEMHNSNWRMFNTVTDYIDHYNSKVENDNGFSMFGSGYQTKLRAFKMLSN